MPNDNILLKGCALVIDDEINNANERICKIINRIELRGTFFVKLENIPPRDTWSSLSQFSYLILDWQIKQPGSESIPVGVGVGQSIMAAQKALNREFVEYVVQNYFMPIFIFSNQIAGIKEYLAENTIVASAMSKEQVSIYDKSKLISVSQIEAYFNTWLKKSRQTQVLKKFDTELQKTKNAFLVEMNSLNQNWVDIVQAVIKKEHTTGTADEIKEGINFDFNELIRTSFLGKLGMTDYTGIEFKKPVGMKSNDVMQIYNAMKFVQYDVQPENSCEGDVYYKEEMLAGQVQKVCYINLTAPCDLRTKNMILVKGIPEQDDIEETDDGTNYSSSYCVPFLLSEKVIKFKFRNMRLHAKPSDVSKVGINIGNGVETFTRIGRLTHPYITALRQRFANFLTRQGIPRHPK